MPKKAKSKTPRLGVAAKTGRGFPMVEFTDRYDAKCTLMCSSVVGDYPESLERPGSSAVWLGVDDADPKILKTKARELGMELPPGEVSGWMPYPIPKDVLLSTSMHLDREMVAGLIVRLQEWLDTFEFKDEA
jgi:hypothetical protein